MISINSIKKSDYYKIIQIEQNLFKKPMKQRELNSFLSQNSTKIWKIEKDKIIGYISFYQVIDEVEIIKIGIIKSYQRSSYGSLLIKELKKLNIKKIFLEVSTENVKAINFYIKNGFKQIGFRKGYYRSINGSSVDALRLSFINY
ncbi:GNAT family N-acetyltransferase [Alphaproteobacteria bacterium]|nr:GNAT family N-acetyltransferase [Alphaproteobacteria bacterium]